MQSSKHYSATYQIAYITDVDTGTTTISDLDIMYSDSVMFVSSNEFLNLSSPTNMLFIDHINKQVVYMPFHSVAENQNVANKYLSFYFPSTEDNVSFKKSNGTYLITIKPENKNINTIEYIISEKTKQIKSISLFGQVHPLYYQYKNSEMRVVLSSYQTGNKAQIKKSNLLLNNYIGKNDKGEYYLKKYNSYQLQVINAK
jgi:hypothetical protein